MCWISVWCVCGGSGVIFPVCGKGFSVVRESPFGSAKKYVRACGKTFFAIRECRRGRTDSSGKCVRRVGTGILWSMMQYRMQGKPVMLWNVTHERNGHRARLFSILIKNGVKIFYFQYLVNMLSNGASHHSRKTWHVEPPSHVTRMEVCFLCLLYFSPR